MKNFALFLILPISFLIFGCTEAPVTVSDTVAAVCANIDWYEAGRSDGRMGYGKARLAAHQQRCDSTPHPVEKDLYANGREVGLIDFCSPTGGIEAGKSGILYEKVCPAHSEETFLAHYEIGKRIQALENDNYELESRITNLIQLASPSAEASSMRAQIEQLRARRSQNNSEISNLESKASVDL